MSTTITTIVCAVLASNALFAFVQFMITRRDTNRNLGGRLNRIERDSLRTQLLLLILMKPEEEHEIMLVAEHYFKDLSGDWYMTGIFNKWLVDYDVAFPEWFNNTK